MRKNRTIKLHFDKQNWLEAMEIMQKANYENGNVEITTSNTFKEHIFWCFSSLCEQLTDSIGDFIVELSEDFPEEASQIDYALYLRCEEIDYANELFEKALETQFVSSEVFGTLLNTLYHTYTDCKMLADALDIQLCTK